MSIELFNVGGTPTFTANEFRTTWQIARNAMTTGFDSLELEELVACFASEPAIRGANADWLSMATEIIHADFRNELTLDGIASRVGISPNHLSTAFKAFHGVPISKFVRRLRLEYALKRLDTDPVPWVAAGFYDASHFWHACQADLGLKPSEIRALNP